jgi:hypothetical protein
MALAWQCPLAGRKPTRHLDEGSQGTTTNSGRNASDGPIRAHAGLMRVNGHEIGHIHGEYPLAVDDLTEGFKVTGNPQDIDVICIGCKVSAWP